MKFSVGDIVLVICVKNTYPKMRDFFLNNRVQIIKINRRAVNEFQVRKGRHLGYFQKHQLQFVHNNNELLEELINE